MIEPLAASVRGRPSFGMEAAPAPLIVTHSRPASSMGTTDSVARGPGYKTLLAQSLRAVLFQDYLVFLVIINSLLKPLPVKEIWACLLEERSCSVGLCPTKRIWPSSSTVYFSYNK